jgi:hypothetical protein
MYAAVVRLLGADAVAGIGEGLPPAGDDVLLVGVAVVAVVLDGVMILVWVIAPLEMKVNGVASLSSIKTGFSVVVLALQQSSGSVANVS